MNLDTPTMSEELHEETYAFIHQVITGSQPVKNNAIGTILPTHIPLHKEAGICMDTPYFKFEFGPHTSGIKKQNHLSYDADIGILKGVFGISGHPNAPARGMGRNGIILNEYGHEGCDIYHFLPGDRRGNATARQWKAARYKEIRS
jgi:hypothetical protein